MKVTTLFSCKEGDRVYKVGDSQKRVIQIQYINRSYGNKVYSVTLTNGKYERKDCAVVLLRNISDPEPG